MSVGFYIGLRWAEDEPFVEWRCDSFEDALEEWHRLAKAKNRPLTLRLFYRPENETSMKSPAGYQTSDDKEALVIHHGKDASTLGGCRDMATRPRGVAGIAD